MVVESAVVGAQLETQRLPLLIAPAEEVLLANLIARERPRLSDRADRIPIMLFDDSTAHRSRWWREDRARLPMTSKCGDVVTVDFGCPTYAVSVLVDSLRVGATYLQLYVRTGDRGASRALVASHDRGDLEIRWPFDSRNPYVLNGADRLPLIQWFVPGSAGGNADEFWQDWTPTAEKWLDHALPTFADFVTGWVVNGADGIDAETVAWASVGVTDPARVAQLAQAWLDPYQYLIGAVWHPTQGDPPSLPFSRA